ncbi:MAG: recombinase family protein [Christensenellales bacterium]
MVKEIYQRYAGGEGYTRIARDLNERKGKEKK